MSKIAIENYRGFDIEFDTSFERFQCIITDDLTKESQSYSAVKKFIDDYKKENQDFKPFYAIKTPSSFSDFKRIKIIGIRKDKRFIISEGGKKGQLSEYHEQSYMLEKECNNSLIQKLQTLEKEIEEYRNLSNERRKDIHSKLDVTTLNDYKKTLLS